MLDIVAADSLIAAVIESLSAADNGDMVTAFADTKVFRAPNASIAKHITKA